MFDTHCHLNFSAFKKTLPETVDSAVKVGVNQIVVPGTDPETSKKAVEISGRFDGVYAAVGIHPHHIFNVKTQNSNVKSELQEIENIINNKKVVAVGEVGIDRYFYQKTKYENYRIDEKFIKLQKEFLKEQINLAIRYKKSLILHNREAKKDLLEIIGEPAITEALMGKAVFHCCEPDEELLIFAKKHRIFIGVDGDITYRKDKQQFIKNIPPDLLVLETDSPLLLPEPLRSQKKYPNKPENLTIIAEFIANLIGIPFKQLNGITTENAKKLFDIQ